MSYAYNGDGTLKTKTHGTVVTTMDYDEVQRMISKIYAGVTTPAVSLCYDGSTSGNCTGAPTTGALLGRLTMTKADTFVTKYFDHDGLGRVGRSEQSFSTATGDSLV